MKPPLTGVGHGSEVEGRIFDPDQRILSSRAFAFLSKTFLRTRNRYFFEWFPLKFQIHCKACENAPLSHKILLMNKTIMLIIHFSWFHYKFWSWLISWLYSEPSWRWEWPGIQRSVFNRPLTVVSFERRSALASIFHTCWKFRRVKRFSEMHGWQSHATKNHRVESEF